MNLDDKIKNRISEIENDIKEINKELEDPNVHNRSGKLQSIEYAKEMILDLKKVLEEREKNG